MDTKENTIIRGNKDLKDFLLLNAFSSVAPGIAQGKAGVALALFAMAREQQDEELEEQAFDLLQQALVYSGKNIHFSVGSAGIGFVLMYLIRHHFIEADFLELFDKQHRHILKTICQGELKLKWMQEYAELLLYLSMAAFYVPRQELQQAENVLADRLQKYFRMVRGKAVGNFSLEEFYRSSSLLLTLYREEEAGKKWWEEIKACCQSWDERTIVYENAELGYKLMRYGKSRDVREAMELGRQMVGQALENRFPEIMSLREQTNWLFFFSQSSEWRTIPTAVRLQEEMTERWVYTEKKRLEEQIVRSAWHYAFYCGLEGGVARLLLLRGYWVRLARAEQLPQLECIFY